MTTETPNFVLQASAESSKESSEYATAIGVLLVAAVTAATKHFEERIAKLEVQLHQHESQLSGLSDEIQDAVTEAVDCLEVESTILSTTRQYR